MSEPDLETEHDVVSASDLVGQKLQSAEEVYVYKIPPLKTSGGHRAEDWNLASPLKTCSLVVEQHGDQLHLLFQFRSPQDCQLFACAKIDVKKFPLEYFVETVVDSSRYFVVRIVDERTGREARIGFGFRDREEATDFRECLQYYVRSMKRQEQGEDAIRQSYQGLGEKLKLAEGEKIHIHLGTSKKSTITTGTTPKKSISANASAAAGGPFLLKKPPSPPKLVQDVSISFGEFDINDDDSAAKEGGEVSSTVALGELEAEDEDDWGDFEDATLRDEAKVENLN